jgi:DNA invertase Pin-like site-specific DNA recombinase
LVRDIYMDKAQSGGVPLADRPAGRRLLLDLQRGDHLIVTAYDRMGRDIVDMLTTLRLLHKRGVFVHMLDLLFIASMDPADPMTEIYLSQFAQFAQLERRRIGVRTKQALHAKRAMGYVISGGGVGPGYRIEPNPEWREDMTKEEKKRIGRQLMLPCPMSADYFDQAYKMWFGGEKIPAIQRHLKNHPDAANWGNQRLRYHLHKERARRHDEYQRQQRDFIFGGSGSE